MNNKPVLFIDSGIGGIPYCRDFQKKNLYETVCYLADHENYPYGPRGKEELISILLSLTEKLVEKTNPKIIVLACNTATIAAISSLREKFPNIPFVGTIPAIKPAAIASKNKKIGVLGTARTIEELHNLHLTDETFEITGITASELVDFIELYFDTSNEEEKIEVVKKYIYLFIEENVDTVVLGCTHFLFLIEEFRREAKQYFKIFDSLDGITRRIESILDENEGVLRAGKDNIPSHKLFVTGVQTSASLWEARAKAFGFNLSILEMSNE